MGFALFDRELFLWRIDEVLATVRHGKPVRVVPRPRERVDVATVGEDDRVEARDQPSDGDERDAELLAETAQVPVVIASNALPIANEQSGIAARIRHAGVGEFLATKGLSASRLRTTIERVHTEPSFRQRARQCANELERVDGLRRAATIVELAIAENRRGTRDDLVAD